MCASHLETRKTFLFDGSEKIVLIQSKRVNRFMKMENYRMNNHVFEFIRLSWEKQYVSSLTQWQMIMLLASSGLHLFYSDLDLVHESETKAF